MYISCQKIDNDARLAKANPDDTAILPQLKNVVNHYTKQWRLTWLARQLPATPVADITTIAVNN